MQRSTLLAVVAAAALIPRAGSTDPLDQLGFGPRAAAMGTAGVAQGEAVEAAWVNPAAAGHEPDVSLALGWLAAFPDAQLNGRGADLDAAHGVVFGAALPFRLGEVRFGAALALHVPDRFLARIDLPGATEARLLRWSDWIHVTSASAVLSVNIAGMLALGAGVALRADATALGGIELGADERGSFGSADVALEMPVRAAPVVGLLFEAAPFLAVGLTYRGELAMDVDIDLRADADFADESLTGEAGTRLRGTASYAPQSVTTGITARWAGFTVDADLALRFWSGLDRPCADVETAIALGASAPIVHRLFPQAAWLDVFVPAVGLQYGFVPVSGHRLAFRAGYSYEPSPVPPQTGLSNVADPDRHLWSFGAGWKTRLPELTESGDGSWFGAALAFQIHRLVPFETGKDLPELAGGPLAAEGWVWSFQLWTGVTL